MNVLLLCSSLMSQPMDPASVAASRFAEHLADGGHGVVIATVRRDPSLPPGSLRRWEAGGISIVSAIAPSNRGPTRRGVHAADTHFRALLGVLRPDAVVAFDVRGLGFEWIEAVRASGAALVVSMHDLWWPCPRSHMVRSDGTWCRQRPVLPTVCATCVPMGVEPRLVRSRQILNHADRVLVPHEYWVQALVDSGFSADGFAVVPPAAHWSVERSQAVPAGPLRFGFVGGDRPEAGYRLLEAALRRIRRSDYELLIVDPDDEADRIPLGPEGFDLSGYIRIVPRLDSDRVGEFLDDIDVLVLPTPNPMFDSPLVWEAFNHGVWPVIPAIGTVPTAFQDGRNASLVALDGTSRPLAQALGALLDSPATVRSQPRRDGLPTSAQYVATVLQHVRDAVLARGASAAQS